MIVPKPYHAYNVMVSKFANPQVCVYLREEDGYYVFLTNTYNLIRIIKEYPVSKEYSAITLSDEVPWKNSVNVQDYVNKVTHEELGRGKKNRKNTKKRIQKKQKKSLRRS